ncbi:MAG: trigger factor [Acutalibacteraceae bacterium]
MSLKKADKIDTNLYEVEVAVDGETFNDAVTKVYNRQKKNITVPGFRKGKAPRGMIEKYYGEGVFYNNAFEQIFPDAVQGAVDEAGIEIVDNPYDVDIVEVGKDGVDFTFKVTVKPEIVIGDYKGLKAEKPIAEVTDEDVQSQLDAMLERSARFVEVEREAANDDLVTIDFDGYVDGKAFEGGKGEGYELTLGSGQFIPGFEDQIVGHKAGENFDVVVTFPEDYVEDLAGKEATFKVVLNAVKEKQLPELDDDFVTEVSEYDTVDELKQHTREDLESSKKEASDAEVDSQIFDALAGIVENEIPEVMFEHQVDDAVSEFGYQIQSQGLDLKTYLSYTGMTEKDLRESFRPRAENQVKCRLALEKISELENIEVTKEDLDAQYKDLAEQYGMEESSVRNILSEDDISKDVKTKKALEAVKAAADITEVPQDQYDAEKAAKAAAKQAEAEAEDTEAEESTEDAAPAEASED